MIKKIKDLMKRLRRQQNGFTLIELAVILAVIGILAGIGVMKYIDVTAGARQTTAQARLADVKSCISMAIAKKGGHASIADVESIVCDGFPSAATTSTSVSFTDVVDGTAGKAPVVFEFLTGTDGNVTNAQIKSGTTF